MTVPLLLWETMLAFVVMHGGYCWSVVVETVPLPTAFDPSVPEWLRLGIPLAVLYGKLLCTFSQLNSAIAAPSQVQRAQKRMTLEQILL